MMEALDDTALLERLIGRGFDAITFTRDEPERRLLAAQRLSKVVHRGLNRDAREPGAHGRLSAKLGERLDRRYEDVLSQVLHVTPRPDHSHEEALDMRRLGEQHPLQRVALAPTTCIEVGDVGLSTRGRSKRNQHDGWSREGAGWLCLFSEAPESSTQPGGRAARLVGSPLEKGDFAR